MVKEYGTVVETRADRGNRSTRRKPAPLSFCVSGIPHELTWDRKLAVAVEGMNK
jgi:hypothetical protein